MGRQARVLMVQGTMSNAGKSVMVAGLCRLLARRGLQVVPFKAQNMSLNSFATPDGGEIGRAQAVQAEASMAVPTVQMNPILLKPEGDRRSQVVVLGKAVCSASAREYYEMKPRLWPVVTEALDQLRARADVVIIEGAGSPAEINLRAHEIVNMRVARYADAPVLLVGDIDRGGVFASLVGTMELLEPEERALVKGFVINKFRGDPSLLTPGLDILQQRTRVPTLGVLPYFTDIYIPEEDSLGLREGGERQEKPALDIAVIRMPHLANFDDFDPLRREPTVNLRFVSRADLLGRPDLVILPGSKTTLEDLRWLADSGLRQAVLSLRAAGTPIIGICAGYQMLGQRLLDPDRLEGRGGEAAGLGLLPLSTIFQKAKATVQVEAAVVPFGNGLLAECGDAPVRGYEIHMGRAQPQPAAAPFRVLSRSGAPVQDMDGSVDTEGRVFGTYIHGLFQNGPVRRAILSRLAGWKGVPAGPFAADMDSGREFDKLADFMAKHLDLAALFRATGLEGLAQ